MDALTMSAGIQSTGSAKDLAMLKKTQDLMKQQSAQLLAALPEALPPPGPPGVGGNLDIRA